MFYTCSIKVFGPTQCCSEDIIPREVKDLKLVESAPPWYSFVKPKPIYESDEAKGFWDVAVHAVLTYVRANRVDLRFVTTRQSKSGQQK